MLILAGCNEKKERPPAAPPPVTVSEPLEREVIDWDEYTGFLQSPEVVDVRARVGGLIVSAPFEEGAVVNDGGVLVNIDPSPYQADLEAKQAAVDQAQAQVGVAQVTFERYKEAGPGGAVSKLQYDTALANLKEAQAGLEQAKAALASSQLNLNWCKVTAPVGGRVSDKYVTVGNLITGGTASGTLLTRITSLDPMYCYFTVDERSVLRYRRLEREMKRRGGHDVPIPCFMELADESNFPHEGRIDFVDNQVDRNTGTLRVRAVFGNSRNVLLSGYFARVRVPGSGRYRALLVPDEAVGTDQSERFLLTVGPGDAVRRHRVTVGALFGRLRAITDGIQAGDRVIINGQIRAMPGERVRPREMPIDPSMFAVMAPGSPATQALPPERDLPTSEPASRQGPPPPGLSSTRTATTQPATRSAASQGASTLPTTTRPTQ